MSRKKEEEKKMPFIVATYVYASSQGQCMHSARTNRNIKLVDLDIRDIADSGRELDDEDSFETTMTIVIFIMSCVSVVGFFIIITIMMFKLFNRNQKSLQIPSVPSFNQPTSNKYAMNMCQHKNLQGLNPSQSGLYKQQAL